MFYILHCWRLLKVKEKKTARSDKARTLLFDRSLTSLFAVSVHEMKKAGVLSNFERVIDIVGDKKSQEFKLLKTYIDDSKHLLTQNESISIDQNKGGYNSLLINLKDLTTIQKYAKPFKRELSKLVLERYGSYLEFAVKAKVQPSNISKFFNPQNESKPRIVTMEKFVQLLGINDIEVRIYPDDEKR